MGVRTRGRRTRLGVSLGLLGTLLPLISSLGPARRERTTRPFSPHRLISERAFFDSDAVDVRGVAAFLRATPHGGPSALAGVRLPDGRTAARAIVEESRRQGLNPIVLLAKLQVEQSLISRHTASARSLAYAMGCACHQGRTCRQSVAGLGRQLRCAARALRRFVEQLAARGTTRTLWRVASARRAECGTLIVPANPVTAALYTYTPYALEGRGGNWLFQRLFQRYAWYLGYLPPLETTGSSPPGGFRLAGLVPTLRSSSGSERIVARCVRATSQGRQ